MGEWVGEEVDGKGKGKQEMVKAGQPVPFELFWQRGEKFFVPCRQARLAASPCWYVTWSVGSEMQVESGSQ